MKTANLSWRALLLAALCVLASTAIVGRTLGDDSVAFEPGVPGVRAVHRAGTNMGYDEITVTVRYHLESESLGVIYLWLFNPTTMGWEAVDAKGVEDTAPAGPGSIVIFTVTLDPHEEVINEDEYPWPALAATYDVAISLEGFESGLTLDGDGTLLTVEN